MNNILKELKKAFRKVLVEHFKIDDPEPYLKLIIQSKKDKDKEKK